MPVRVGSKGSDKVNFSLLKGIRELLPGVEAWWRVCCLGGRTLKVELGGFYNLIIISGLCLHLASW